MTRIRCLRLDGLGPLLLTLALGSCGPSVGQFAPACPVPGLLAPLAELTWYRAGTGDIRDLIIRARISDVGGTCEPGGDANTVVAKVRVAVDATRGPAMQGNGLSLPVFIAVTTAGTVIDKRLFSLPVTFAANVDNARAVSGEFRLELAVSQQKSAAAYGVVGGFQLTPEEVAAWRRDNPK